MRSEDFSWDRLVGLLEMGNSRVYWRHDIDFSPACAVEMAKLEHTMGIHATYCIRTDEEEYSLQEAASLAICLVELDHHVGLHVSLDLPRTAAVRAAQLAAAASVAFGVAQETFGTTTRRVSLHAPPPSALWRPIEGFEHCMGPCWKGYYLGDSRGVWKESPEAFLLLDAPVQLSLHPEWWFLPAAERAALRVQEAAKP